MWRPSPGVLLFLSFITALGLTFQVIWHPYQLQLRRPVPLDLVQFSTTELEEQIAIHAQLMRRGGDQVRAGSGPEEFKLTHKYWELVTWIKNLSTSTDSAVPVPYDFGNRSLWGPNFPGAVDKVLAQVVWRLQLLVANYARKYTRLADYQARSEGPKRIFTGNTSLWPEWALLADWPKTGQISGCYSRILPQKYADLEPKCHLVENSGADPNWASIDAIVEVFHLNPLGSTQDPHAPPPPVPWVWYTAESPAMFPPPPNPSIRIRRLASSYMADSPVQHKYLKWVYYDPAIRQRAQGRDFARRKTRSVAMLVSNCAATNGRLEYARQLQRYIDVDIFGWCGDHICGKDDKSCFRTLAKYRFYLAFENSNCQEYVTEKLHRNALENGVVPVVMGAPPAFYRLHAPQNSYIHVQDFESPRVLALYLRALASNSTMYNDYFKWGRTGEPAAMVAAPFLCSLCALLHQPTPLHSEMHRLRDTSDWSPNSARNGAPLCLEEGQWYWP